jgi:thiamine biosynthesis lipoprotein
MGADDHTLRAHTFLAMGTDVSLLTGPAEEEVTRRAASVVESIFAREEQRFSRFRPDTELSRVNARAGEPTIVSHGFASLVRFALDAARRTRGRFDPTVLDAVIAAGYDRDFDEILAGARASLRPSRPGGRWREIALEGTRLLLPEGAGLDLGGVAKGWTVDLAAEAAVEGGPPWAIVNAGGDLRLAGAPPEPGIEVAVEDPDDRAIELLRLVVTSGALATSSTTRRAWGPGLHHLIDPSTGAPADTGVVQATAWAPTCAEAEVAAKEALLGGVPVLDRVPAVLVKDDGRIETNLGGAREAAA